MKKILILGTALLVSAVSFSQQPCGTDLVEEQMLNANPAYEQERAAWLNLVNIAQLEEVNGRAMYRIPVVFHVMHRFGTENISRAQIYDCLRILNEDFARLNSDSSNTRALFKPLASAMDIEFVLANKDPNGFCTDGITRTYSPITYNANDDVKYAANGGKNAWPTDKYLNIWVVGSIKLDDNTNGTVLGYAYFPFSAGQSYYGIVMHNRYTGSIGTSVSDGRTITHEAGHCFGLAHTFNNGCGNNCNNSGDNVCDTPPTSTNTFGCNTMQNTCSNDMNGAGSEFTTDVVDQIENYMSYDDCQNMFTKGQKARAHASINTTNLSTMVSGSNATFTGIDGVPVVCAPNVDFYAENPIVCVGKTVNIIDYTTDSEPTSYLYTFQSDDTTFTATTANPQVVFYKSGLYTVTLNASNNGGSGTKVRTDYIRVFDDVTVGTHPYIDNMDNQPISSGRWGTVAKGVDGFKGFEEITTVGLTNNSCVYVNNAQAQYKGFKSELYSGAYDLQNIPKPVITFKTAFAKKINSDKGTLRVLVSTNCGTTWNLMYVANTEALVSAPNNTSAFVPANNEWFEHSVPLNGFQASSPVLRIKFEFTGDGGNNFYLEDVNILAYASLEENNSKFDVKLFPNPGNNFQLQSERVIDEVNIYTVDGKKIGGFTPNSTSWTMENGELLASGLYYIQIKCGTLQEVKQWIKY